MKSFFVLLLAAAAISLVISDKIYSESELTAWNKFKSDHGRTYDAAEESRRLEKFAANLARINAHNVKFAAGETSYSMAINELADRFDEELPHRGYRRPT